jgi:membrane-associated phospholipid phosphatase
MIPIQSEMENTKLRDFISNLRAVDVFLVLVLFLYSLLGAVFHSRVKNWTLLTLTCIGMAFLFVGFNHLQQRMTRRFGRFFFRVLSVSIVLIYTYEAALRLMFIIWPTWKDQALINLERVIFGVQPTIWLQAFIFPGLTEWMMFSYLSYFALYPTVSAVLYFRRGEDVMEKFLFLLCFNNIFCNALYLFFPVDNPMSTLGHLYTVPLKGYVFTAAGEYLRAHLMSAGGGMPSGHVAATLVMLLTVFRDDRRSFYALAPVGFSVILATFYCRFHYLSDSVMGLLAGLICWWVAPAVRKSINRSLAP